MATLIVSVVNNSIRAQDARESENETTVSKQKEPHPLTQLMASLNSKLRPELHGQHPRVYVTAAELETLRQSARTTHRELWQNALQNIRALQVPPPAP
ncbi:MAG: DUF4962 domain-containing protein, partial [Pyrinomonadaceae bacterium]